MKKRLAAVAMSAVVFLSASAFSQVSLRPGAVIGLGMFGFTDSYTGGSYTSDTRTGFLAGGVLDMGFSKYISLEPGVEYSGRGGKSSGSGTEEGYPYTYTATENFGYLAIPINVKVKYPVAPVFSPYVLAGVNLGILMSATETADVDVSGIGSSSTSTDIKSSMNSIDFGIDLGAGAEFDVGPVIPFVDFGWVIGLTNFAAHAESGESATNHGFEIKAGIKFKT